MSGCLRCSFDYLEGVARRGELPQFEEVEIVALFRPKGGVDAVRAQLEEDIIAVGHDTLDAWPKWCGGRRVGCVCMVVALAIRPVLCGCACDTLGAFGAATVVYDYASWRLSTYAFAFNRVKPVKRSGLPKSQLPLPSACNVSILSW